MFWQLAAAELHLAEEAGPLVTVLAASAAGFLTWLAGELAWGRH
jgi:hypothetical protein